MSSAAMGWLLACMALALPLLFVVPGPSTVAMGSPAPAGPSSLPTLTNPAQAWTPVEDSELSTSGATSDLSLPATQPVDAMVTLGFSNQAGLNAFLSGLSDPSSPLYHHYLTQAAFNAEFGPSAAAYASVVGYLRAGGATHVETLSDHQAVYFQATPSAVMSIFHTSIGTYRDGTERYEAPVTTPELPGTIAPFVLGVEGLTTDPAYTAHLAPAGLERGAATSSLGPGPRTASGYLPPATYDGAQLEYLPDMQVAYEVPDLYSSSYPLGMVVATILWGGSYSGSDESTPCGSLTTDQSLGGFDPQDISAYYNETLPAGQPHATYAGVPIDGAVAPSCLASYDTSGAVFENTLDLESVGSLAPGASIYNVYGPGGTFAQLDDDFSYILSASGPLANVSVISNSWGGTDNNDSTWLADLEESQARGISVLASSGDNDDNTASSKYFGSIVEFPSSMSYNTYGMTAVGGTTDTLDPSTLALSSEVAWNISAQDTVDGGPAGSTGGISAIFAEPAWQRATEANSLIGGAGRGVPDIAAIANNTLVTITVDGVQYIATNASGTGEFYYAWGTSIASPLTAGILAAMDNYFVAKGDSKLGFINPVLYHLAGAEYNASGTNVVSFVSSGGNYMYRALPGYNLVDGWGSLHVWNYTQAILSNVPTAISSFTIQPATFPVGATTYLNVSVTGSAAPFAYAWSGLPAGCTSQNTSTLVCTPTVTGKFTVTVTVTDTKSRTVSASVDMDVLVAGSLYVKSFTVAPSTIPLGGTAYLNVTASGGTPPYAYAYSKLPTGCTSANVSALACTPTAAGNYTVISVTVTDHNATQATSQDVVLHVVTGGGSTPTIQSFTASPASLSLGQSTYLNVSATGGTLPYTYSYSGLPAGCLSSNTSSLLCTPSSTGTSSITVTVTDTLDQFTIAQLTLTVKAAGSLVVQAFTVSPASIPLGGTAYFNVSASGGKPSYTYVYSQLPTGCSSSSVASLACVPTAEGTFTGIYVTVRDSGTNSTQSSTVSLTVTAPSGNSPEITSFTVSPSTIPLGGTAYLNVSVTAGTPPYTYSFLDLPPGCTSSDETSLACSPTSPGNYTSIVAKVTDSADKSTTSGTVTLKVVSGSTGPTVTALQLNPNPVTVRTPFQMTVTVNGGTPPISYTYAGLPGGCTTEDLDVLSCTPNSTGNFSVSVTVRDAVGRTATKSAELQVVAASPPSSNGVFFLSTLDLLLLGAVLVGVIVAAVLLRRKGRSPAAPPPPTPPPYTAPGYAPGYAPPPYQAPPPAAPPPSYAPPPPAAPAPAVSAGVATAALCRGCGHPLEPGAAFCRKCGRAA